MRQLMQAVQRLRLWRLRQQGLQLGSDVRLLGMPFWGSEPYLISIGNRVTISGRVAFLTHDGATHVFRQQPSFEHVIKYGRIVVEDGAFIGFGAILLPGVRIGAEAVVAAGAVVTTDVAPQTVVGGNPARVLTTVEEYAARSLANTPAYRRELYHTNKRAELMRLFPYPWR